MNKVGVIILSRFNSSRLPGKALLTIEGKPILLYIYERLAEVFSPEAIIIATSNNSSDNPIYKFTQKHNIKCFRGNLTNVAERFYFAGKSLNLDIALRINGDNIFVDIPLLKRIKAIAESKDYIFISNVKNRTFPKGMSIEAVKLNYYAQLLPSINKFDRYKEHVTLFIYENESDKMHFIFNTTNSELAGIQMALDTSKDFIRTQKIIQSFIAPHTCYNLKEISEILKKNNE